MDFSVADSGVIEPMLRGADCITALSHRAHLLACCYNVISSIFQSLKRSAWVENAYVRIVGILDIDRKPAVAIGIRGGGFERIVDTPHIDRIQVRAISG